MKQIGGPVIDGGEYAHGIFCSGSRRYPRSPGLNNCCSCYNIDLWYRKLFITRDGANAKRTLWIANCDCGRRFEFPFSDEPIPREVYCNDCGGWSKVKEVSWDGLDFAKLLPVFPKRY